MSQKTCYSRKQKHTISPYFWPYFWFLKVGSPEDLLSAPTSQAYVERVFSACGHLTSGKRSRLQEIANRAFLKMNIKFYNWLYLTVDEGSSSHVAVFRI